MIDIQKYGQLSTGGTVHAATLSNGSLRAAILSYGGRLHHFSGTDGFNIVHALPDLAAYEADTRFYGAVIGRVANRIMGAAFEIDGQKYVVPENEPNTCLHGGPDGFHVQNWEMEAEGETLVLQHTSPDGHAGFPGQVDVTARITLMDDVLQLEFQAITTAPTPLSLTWHPYFNLSGEPTINDHQIDLQTRFGTRKIDKSVKCEREGFHQITRISRYNRSLTISSDYPEFQLYSGDHLETPRAGFAVEPQYAPNDINQARLSLLRPGEPFAKTIAYKLELDSD